MSDAPRDGRAPWLLAEGLVLLAVSLGALAFQLHEPSLRVAETDYRAVASTLEQEAQPGDVVLLFPWWTERARLFVPEWIPVVGYLGSDGDELRHHPRIWVLGEPRLPFSGRGDFEGAFLPDRTPAGPERRFGNLSLRLYANGRARPLSFTGASALATAQVYLEQPGGARQPCTWNGRAHECPNGKRLALEWHEVHFRPLQCLRFDAPGGPTRLVLELPPVGAAASMVVEAGYTGERGAHVRGSVTDSQLTLEVDGAATPLLLPAGVEKLHRLEHGPLAAGARLRLWLQADNPHERQVCVTLDGLGASPR